MGMVLSSDREKMFKTDGRMKSGKYTEIIEEKKLVRPNRHFTSNMTKLLFCQVEQDKLHKSSCAKPVKTHWRCLEAVTATRQHALLKKTVVFYL